MWAVHLLLVISNFVALCSVRWSIQHHHFLEALVLLQSAVASAAYHAFTAVEPTRTALPWAAALKHFDFYSAVLVLICLSVYTMELGAQRAALVVVFLSSAAVFLLQLTPFNNDFEIGISSVCVAAVALSYVVRRRTPSCRPRELVLTLMFISAALFCFHSGDSIGPYWLMHSAWHVLIYVSVYFVLNIPVAAPLRRVLSRESLSTRNTPPQLTAPRAALRV